MCSPKVEIPENEDGEMSDTESNAEIRMEMVEIIRLHCSMEMPEGRNRILNSKVKPHLSPKVCILTEWI